MFARLTKCFQSEKQGPTEKERKYAQFQAIVARVEKNQPDLVEIDFSGTRLSTELLLQFCRALKQNQHVRKLNISNSEVTVDVARLLADAKITTLIASNCHINDDVMREIARSSSLQYLDISANYLTDRGVELLSCNRHITDLILDFNSPGLGDAVVKLATMNQLIRLSLAADGVKDDHLGLLIMLPFLETLCLGGSDIHLDPLKRVLMQPSGTGSLSLKFLSLPCTNICSSYDQQDIQATFPKISFLFEKSKQHTILPAVLHGLSAKL